MQQFFQSLTRGFNPISLEQLNEKAQMLDRSEKKYIVDRKRIPVLMREFKKHFYILKIKKKTIFTYKNKYFDTDDLVAYNHHNQGRRKRFKARTRYYVDSDICYFEIKLKGKRGSTIKKRIKYPTVNYGILTHRAMSFLQMWYFKIYHQRFHFRLSPQMAVEYQRITFVNIRESERLTIDFNLSYSNDTRDVTKKPFVIIETKSPNGQGKADMILKKYKIRGASCSKYCLGANLLQLNVKYNHFKPLIKKYLSLPAYSYQ